ncbi:MAG TPA: M17 family peptidase N-terminal domain-containing protein, partial [Microbacteriaceae bacterium]|nr:M17 family peptidase N-terminal domain-containing protein [Microbacteriaceae bacterium]
MSSSAPLPALTILDAVALTVGAAPSDAQALGFTVFTTGDVPAELGLDRAALERAGFTGKAGSSLVLPQAEGPELVAVGAGEEGELDAAALRDLAATFARAAARHARIALIVSALGSADAATAAGVLSEGTLLARYTYTALKTEPKAMALEAAT